MHLLSFLGRLCPTLVHQQGLWSFVQREPLASTCSTTYSSATTTSKRLRSKTTRTQHLLLYFMSYHFLGLWWPIFNPGHSHSWICLKTDWLPMPAGFGSVGFMQPDCTALRAQPAGPSSSSCRQLHPEPGLGSLRVRQTLPGWRRSCWKRMGLRAQLCFQWPVGVVHHQGEWHPVNLIQDMLFCSVPYSSSQTTSDSQHWDTVRTAAIPLHHPHPWHQHSLVLPVEIFGGFSVGGRKGKGRVFFLLQPNS